MKANVRYRAISLLFVVACNRPDAALFGADESAPGDGETGVAGSMSVSGSPTAGAGATASPGATTSGGTATGGTASEPATGGGTPPTPVGAPGGGGVGGEHPPNSQAGAPDGSAGTPEQKPPAPVCGNGIVETGEVCDDAGHAGKDGCDAACNVVCADYGLDTVESEDHHCYNGYDQSDFETAQKACVKRGAHLASISSAAENELARSLVNDSKWLGGLENVPLASEGTGTYAWLTGEAFSYTNWAAREPNHKESHCGAAFNTPCFEHCISILGDGTWADARCDVADGYVCEWEPAGTHL